YRGFPVTTDGVVLGLISLSNLKEVSEEERAEKKVGEIMAPVGREMIIGPETRVEKALRRMSEGRLGRLLVMRDDRFLGMVTQSGLLRYLEIKRALKTPQA
ncbi:MAG TPA: CBS domain-containing protein, partial [Candidatus Udaeobacter sp.]|nr:CBS domain-containing protein [Candidatus Udaeobacter sp.]